MVEYKYNQPYYKLQFSELDEDVVQVLSFEGEEQISRLFEYRFELLSEDAELDAKSILNKKATFTITRGEEDPININGIISHFEQRGRTPDYVSYFAVLVSKMWRLNLTHKCEIYQKMDIEKIVAEVLKNAGFAGEDYEINLNESYPELEYVVQYRESDFDFINRRLEHFGIFYYFDHRDDNDVIVFSDSNDGITGINLPEEINYNPNRDPLSEQETITELLCHDKVVTGLVRLKDYNYRFPSKQLKVESQIDSESPGMYYEYGDHFKDEKEGEFLARVRNEEILCGSKIFKGKGDCRLFRAGFKFNLGKHYREDWNTEYILTKVFSIGNQRGLFGILHHARKIVPTFENYFEAFPLDIAYRPPRITPIPKLYGIMNAVTQAADGEEYAYVDDQGRYRLKMPFDLSESAADEASQAVRLASPHAGAGYGMHFPQHANVEIAWSCIDGNVDRPIGLGTVPNPSNTTPVTSSNKSMNILRTSANNALEMEDKSGSERIKLSTPYANTVIQLGAPNEPGEGIVQKTDDDMIIEVGRNREMTIQKNDSVDIYGDRDIFILGEKKETVVKDETRKIIGKQTEFVKKNISIKTPSNQSLTVGKKITTKAKDNIITVSAKNIGIGAKKNIRIKSKQKIKQEADKDIIIKTDKNLKVSTKKNTNFLVTENFNTVTKKKVTISAKDNLLIKSNKQIELKCGSGSITIKQDGSIKIKGLKVEIEGQTDVKTKALNISSEASVGNKIKGTMVNIEASGINTIKGALVKIN